MARESPDRYLINMSKSKRVGKIFLDYLRNDQFSTAVAPLSPRARAHAPVSMPITWAQVKARPRPHAIHHPYRAPASQEVEGVVRLLRRSTPAFGTDRKTSKTVDEAGSLMLSFHWQRACT